MSENQKIYAIFDFNGTMTCKHTTPSFLVHVIGFTFYFWVVILLPFLLLYLLGILSSDRLHKFFVRLCLKGYTKETLFAKGLSYHDDINQCLNQHAVSKFYWHKRQGHCCILATSAYDIYVKSWGDAYGFDRVLCTEIEFDDHGIATGRIKGHSCDGIYKLKKIMPLVDKAHAVVYAYGDSRGDKEMLTFADHPYYKKFFD